ncbi:hypothetical protein Bpfe_016151 [Biomphalaria pfeifferi]|uniref:Uncharacterized protein n=1 Tax=Biomphalaria pfeifferi TaxID=112525 RepID=A0AAD8BHZ0_BIOPF|nr:hypothetical protein Bpfe_016151 [Biomphalaria pfeifferi]
MLQPHEYQDKQGNAADVDFEEGRHVKVAVSSKGVCVSHLSESRQKREQFEQSLNKVINGNLLPLTTKQALQQQKKLQHYRDLVAKTTTYELPVSEQTWEKTLKETRQAFKTCRKAELCWYAPRVLVPSHQQDIIGAPSTQTQNTETAEPASEHQVRESLSSRKPRAPNGQQPYSVGRSRYDPFKHSTWPFQERKCFFTSGFIPPHQRIDLPTPLERSVEIESLVTIASEESVEEAVMFS